ncbi:hypothetical protein PNP85_00495 [Halobacterium salinarum]|uniref:hypothetical protein n=1 Tax=Halobacterium salinarum TaxID=2242 RepID=UPI0025542D68|nr:hypothetical protein [Halobacterium salinarum]MDL0137994.1 hypothetical protein [Halobacterium salinarum]
METPEQTRTVEGTTYTVDSITRVNQGDSVNVQTTGPENESYQVYVYGNNNGQQDIIANKFVDIDDSGAVSFDTSGYEPGSYVVAIEGAKAPQPFVVSAYDVSVSSPDSAPATGTTELSVSLTETTGDTSVHGVEIAVFTEDTVERVDTTKTDGSYVGELDLSSLSEGDYQVQAVVYSPEAAPQGEQEVIGISDPTTLTIESAPQTTTPSNGGGGGGGGGAPAGTATTTSTSSQNQTTTTATQTTGEATPTTEPSETTSQSQTTSPATASPTATTQADVITPNTGTVEPTTSSNGVVGATPLLLLALLATIALLIRTTN